jgi:hypothetical protein
MPMLYGVVNHSTRRDGRMDEWLTPAAAAHPNLALLEDSPYPYFRGKDGHLFRLFRSTSEAPHKF